MGGGSFGHYWSVKYDMHTKPFPYSDEGVAIVHESMIHLNHIIIKKFIQEGLKPYTIPPSSFVQSGKLIEGSLEAILDITEGNNIIPVTFGDVIHTNGSNFSILSGDTIMSMLTTNLHPKYCIFLTNVDGLFGDVEKADLIHEVNLDQLDNMASKSEFQLQGTNTPDSHFDVTGGMKRKVSESIPIVRSGTNVHFINGFKPERVLDLVNNEKCVGTCFKKDQSQI